ncbi:MAG: transglutaminase-like cysteine peptidase, partial [Xanthobacteraceae bacterium]
MIRQVLSVKSRVIFIAVLVASSIDGLPAVAGPPTHALVSEVAQPPRGWVQFCIEYDPECRTKPSTPREVVLTTKAWKDLEHVNIWVNTHIQPMTDLEHWGV